MTYQILTMTIRDAGGVTRKPESSTVSFRGAELLADGTNYVSEHAKVTALVDAVNAIHIGSLSSIVRGGNRTLLAAPNTHASDASARRELKWLLSAHDTVTYTSVRVEIPCANVSLCATESDYMDQTITEYTNLKTAFDAFQRSGAGNPVSLDSVELVGRNL